MANEIKCPKCGHSFTLDEVMSDELNSKLTAEKEKLRSELGKWKKEQEDKLQQQRETIENDAKKKAMEETSVKLKALEDETKIKTKQLQDLQKKELDLLRDKNELEEKQKQIEQVIEKRFLENKKGIEEKVLQQANEQFELERKEFEIKTLQQNKLIDEMKRKVNQGSMQTQGEAQELLLEEILENTFPFDKVGEVAKGKKGADCLLTVRNKFGQECGTILFESKRTTTWGKDWIDKLKQDLANSGSDIGIIISQTLPDTMSEKFELRDGVWICGFSEFKLLTASLREGLIQVHNATKKQDGKGDKIQMLYDYMTSNEFALQWKNIRDVFKNMQQSIHREKEVMEKLWKNREKQLERAVLNSDHIVGAIEGIAGKDSIDMNLLDDISDDLTDQ